MMTEHHANTGAIAPNLSIKSPECKPLSHQWPHTSTLTLTSHTHTHTHTHSLTHTHSHTDELIQAIRQDIAVAGEKLDSPAMEELAVQLDDHFRTKT